MKKGIRTEIDWNFIGAELANEDAIEQAKFFRGFVDECTGWGTMMQAEAQMIAIHDLLTPGERDVLRLITDSEE